MSGRYSNYMRPERVENEHVKLTVRGQEAGTTDLIISTRESTKITHHQQAAQH